MVFTWVMAAMAHDNRPSTCSAAPPAAAAAAADAGAGAGAASTIAEAAAGPRRKGIHNAIKHCKRPT